MEDEMDNLILKKLEEYGDSIIGESEKKKKVKGKKGDNKSTEEQTLKPESTLKPYAPCAPCSERQKKNRRRRKKKESNDVTEDVEKVKNPHMSGHERRLREMSEMLGLSEFKHEKEIHKEDDVEEIKKTNQPEVVVFMSHKSKRKSKEKKEKLPESAEPVFDMRQARFDVQKFGIKGFHGDDKEDATKALLIKLGAKPPKNKYLNYKELQENRKQEILQEKQKREMDRKLGYKVPKGDKGKKRPRDKNDIGHLDGQAGTWRSGVLVVKKDDLKGIKKSKLK